MSEPMADFLRRVDALHAQRSAPPSWALYEALKAEFSRAFPEATQQQYASAMQRIARAAGV